MVGEERILSEQPVVLLVTGSLLAGGAERVLADMANYWSRRGWRVVLATWTGKEVADFYELHSDIRRVWLDVYSPNRSIFDKVRSNLSRVIRLRRLLSELKPSAVVSFIDTSNMLTILAAAGLKVRTVVSERIHTGHYFGISRGWRLLRKMLYPFADVVIAQTDDAAQALRATCRANVRVIPNPLRTLPRVNVEREPFILAVGRLDRQKGFDLLVRAFGTIRGAFENWRLVILGSGPELSSLIQLRDDLNMQELIEFRPPVKDVEVWMARAGLVVQPSRFEGFPNVVLEAMGMGAPVICADCPSGPAEIIQDGVNGRLVPVEDVDFLAKAMAELMSEPEVRRRLGRQAVKVRERYDQAKIMSRWEQWVLGPQ